MKTTRSQELFEASRKVIPGGVNSPVRAFRNMGAKPLFIASARGSRIRDEDGNELIDYVGSWGPLLFGHAHPRVVEAIGRTLERGTSFGAPTALELRLAERVCAMVPSVEMVRMVSSGTEAAMSAVRLARAATGRERIVKFEGCYHGHADGFLIRAGSGALTHGAPDSPGVPAGLAADTLVAPFNDLGAVERLFAAHAGRIAAVIVEPVAGNMGVVPPEPDFLPGLRALCDREGALLVFDEVITGFRLSRGGAQERYRVLPDLTVLGKILGGGLPAAAYGGRRELMEMMSPAGPVYQAGTLSGNPLAMSAGLAQLELAEEEKPWEELERKASRLEAEIRSSLSRLGAPASLHRVGSMMTLFFCEGPVTDLATATRSDAQRYARLFRELLARGIYVAPSPYEALFISTAHTEEDLTITAAAFSESLGAAFA